MVVSDVIFMSGAVFLGHVQGSHFIRGLYMPSRTYDIAFDTFKMHLIWTNANAILPPEIWLDATAEISWIPSRHIPREIMHPPTTHDAKSSSIIADFTALDNPSYSKQPNLRPVTQTPGKLSTVPDTNSRLAIGPSLYANGTALQGIFAGNPPSTSDFTPVAHSPVFQRGHVIASPAIRFISEHQLALSSPVDWQSYVQIRVDDVSRYILREQIQTPPLQLVRLILETGTYQSNCDPSTTPSPPGTLRLAATTDIFRHEELYMLSGWYDHDPSQLHTDERIALFDNYGEEIFSAQIPYLRMHAWRLAGSIRRLQVRLSIAHFDNPLIWLPSDALVSFTAYTEWSTNLVEVIPPPTKRARGPSDARGWTRGGGIGHRLDGCPWGPHHDK